MSEAGGRLQVVWPGARRVVEQAALARRPDRLEGLRVAQIWDHLFHGDKVFALLEESLRQRVPGIQFISWKAFGSTHGAGEAEVLRALPARLKELGADVVISAIGCCGSCTPAVMRASAACERAGFPTVSVVCEGFVAQAGITAAGLGLPHLPVATLPGHVDVLGAEALRQRVFEVTTDGVVAGLTRAADASVAAVEEPEARDIVFNGDAEAVADFFEEKGWSDGLPIVPPTLARIEGFLRYTDRRPDEVLGVMASDNRAATVWSVAVNGVMAGCRPEYMPILVAVAEAMCDPAFGIERNSSSGAETLIILNGPISDELGFNSGQGVLRDGFRPNTSVGRFFRLYFRNVAGLVLHGQDKATFGQTWRVVMPENEEVLREIGWRSIGAEMGFDPGDSVVTIARYSGGDVMPNVSGSSPDEMMPYIADGVLKQITWQVRYTLGFANGMLRPLLLLTPILARQLAAHGWSKQDVKRYLFEHCRMSAREFQRYLSFGIWKGSAIWNIDEHVRLGKAPGVFGGSDDPERLVPIVHDPEDFMIAVTGDPMRTNAYVFAQTGILGYPTSRRVELPKGWASLPRHKPA